MSHLRHQDAHFREAWELVMNSSPISAVGAVLKARDALLARCNTQLERMLAAQGDTPDAELVALQHEIATHLAVPPVAGAEKPKAPAVTLNRPAVPASI